MVHFFNFSIRLDRFKIVDFWEDLCPRSEEDDFRGYFRYLFLA